VYSVLRGERGLALGPCSLPEISSIWVGVTIFKGCAEILKGAPGYVFSSLGARFPFPSSLQSFTYLLQDEHWDFSGASRPTA
jgi:hypothetical protein